MASERFFEKLAARAAAVDSLLCVGLDPHVKELSEPSPAAAAAFCKRLIDETSGVAAAYKPNAAFFEQFGSEGVKALEEVVAMVPPEIPVLLDAKRGDIGSTSEAYAKASFTACGAGAVTLNGYMGSDSLDPFLRDPAQAAFILCKTSNPGSNDLQTLPVRGSDGQERMLFEQVALLAETRWNEQKNVGLVVGATDIEAIRRVRAVAPSLWILAPGVGAQGGELGAACEAGLFLHPDTGHTTGILFPVSRGISRAESPSVAAEALRVQINAARRAFVEKSTSTAAEAAPVAPTLASYQKQFIEFAIAHSVLKFGEFTLKSGRLSPYFFNAGLFCSGKTMAALGSFYAQAVQANTDLQFDVIFGPAYKGIPLGTAVAMALATGFGRDVQVAYNRKEKKDHGEGGVLVGASLQGKRVLIVDDVITAGTAIREAVQIVSGAGGSIAGVVIALDRQEVTSSASASAPSESAVQSVEREVGCPVVSIVGLTHLQAFLSSSGQDSAVAAAVTSYREKYGCC